MGILNQSRQINKPRQRRAYSYVKKFKACMALAELKTKKVSESDILVISRKFDVEVDSLRSAWRTFQESGGKYIDYRVSTLRGTIKMNPSVKSTYSYRAVTPGEAGDILREYMDDRDINSRELANKYKISVIQIYDWIRELNVSGTLLGKRVLDPKKYAKLVIKDVIWMKKRPDTKRKSIAALTKTEVSAYKRVGEVLVNYLPTQNASK